MPEIGILFFKPQYVKGPIEIGRGNFDEEVIFLASQIVTRCSDGRLKSEIINKLLPDGKENLILVFPIDKRDFKI